MFRRRFLILLLLAVPSCFAQKNSSLKIAAAADLQPVLPPLIDQFEKQTNKKVDASYASSATLATQILNGGPFSLFLSADLSFPRKVVAAGLADSTEPVPYARGTLVLWARNDSPAQPLTLDSLHSPALRTIAVANPEHAPYGRAAKAALEKLGLTDALKSKLRGGGEHRANCPICRFGQCGCGLDFAYLGTDAAPEFIREIRRDSTGRLLSDTAGRGCAQKWRRYGSGPPIPRLFAFASNQKATG